MTLRFGLACVGFLGACSFVFVGCGDDESDDGGGSNKGGDAGAGAQGGSAGAGEGGEGATGQGGTSGTGARGGTSGAGGRGGTAGGGGKGGTAGTGGDDATGGLAGDAGGGPIGGEGGFGGEGGAGTGPGGAGNAGEAGAGGVPDTTADQCKYECVDDDDCARGIDTSYKCHPERKRCENPGLACDSHDDCVPLASGWVGACTSDADCTPLFEECVDVGGRGICASIPYGGVCFSGAEMQMPRFGSTDVVTTVCGSDAGRCDDMGQCFTGCTDPAQTCSVARGRGPNCNATTGLCECTMDTQCTADGVGRCNMTTHLCECGDSTDCTVAGANECVSGRCGCASVTACSATLFPNATPVCE